MSKSVKKPLVIAHRGAPAAAPENTLVSFAKAVEMGADVLEADVHLSQDGVPVVIHDYAVNRTTNGAGHVSDLTWDEISRLDAGAWFSPQFAGEKIPSLEDLLLFAQGRHKLLIELKQSPAPASFGPQIINMLRKYDMESQCEIHSFNEPVLRQIAQLDTAIKLQKLVVGNAKILPVHLDMVAFKGYMPVVRIKAGPIEQYSWANGINPAVPCTTRKLVEFLHQRGQTIYVWTVNDIQRMKTLISWEVDGIITNRPDLLHSLTS